MNLKILKGFFSWKMVDEEHRMVAIISNLRLLGAAKKITDIHGNILYTTDIIYLTEYNSRVDADSLIYVIYKDGKRIGSASIFFAPGREPTTIRPRRVEMMKIETPFGLWVVHRRKNNDFIITHDGVFIGKMVSPFFTFRPVNLIVTEKYEATFWAAIYTLIEYMVHEDDWIAV